MSSRRIGAWDGKPRRKKVWTRARLKKLVDFYQAGEPNWKIAEGMGVSLNAINSQLGILRKEEGLKRPVNKRIVRRNEKKGGLSSQEVYRLKKKVESLERRNKQLRDCLLKIRLLAQQCRK